MRFQSGFSFSEKASLVDPLARTVSRWNSLRVSQKKKTPDDRSKRPLICKPTGRHNVFFNTFTDCSEL